MNWFYWIFMQKLSCYLLANSIVLCFISNSLLPFSCRNWIYPVNDLHIIKLVIISILIIVILDCFIQASLTNSPGPRPEALEGSKSSCHHHSTVWIKLSRNNSWSQQGQFMFCFGLRRLVTPAFLWNQKKVTIKTTLKSETFLLLLFHHPTT